MEYDNHSFLTRLLTRALAKLAQKVAQSVRRRIRGQTPRRRRRRWTLEAQPLYEHLLEELVLCEYVHRVVNVSAVVFVRIARVDDYVLVDLVVKVAV